MRFSIYLACLLVCSSVQAQEAGPAVRRDPTAPSDEILKRLTAAAPPADAFLSPPEEPVAPDEIAYVAPAFPEFKLKGLVLADPDHGTALLEANGQRVAVRLSRPSVDSNTLPSPNAARLSGFSIQGIEFQVLDFSDRSLLLQAPDRTVLVQ